MNLSYVKHRRNLQSSIPAHNQEREYFMLRTSILAAALIIMATATQAQVSTLTRSTDTANGHRIELYEFQIVNGGRVVQSNVLISVIRLDNKNVNLLIELVDSDNDSSWDSAQLKLNPTNEPHVPAAFYFGSKGLDETAKRKDRVQSQELGARLIYHNELVPVTDTRLSGQREQLTAMRDAANRILVAMKANRGLQDSDIETVVRAFLATQPFFKADRDRR